MNNVRSFIIGGFIVGMFTAVGFTAYSAIKKMEEESNEYIPFDEELESELIIEESE